MPKPVILGQHRTIRSQTICAVLPYISAMGIYRSSIRMPAGTKRQDMRHPPAWLSGGGSQWKSPSFRIDAGQRSSRAQDMCSRFCPAPLGIVLWYGKLEFDAPSEHVIPSQCAHWRGNLHRIPRCLSSYRLPFLYYFPKFVHEKWCVYPGDCHASLRTGSQ